MTENSSTVIPPTATPREGFAEDIEVAVRAHFAGAHERVPAFYRRQFLSLRTVSSRHWHNRKDIPGDLMAAPKALWRLSSRLWRQSALAPQPLSGKERALLVALESELLLLAQLQEALNGIARHWIPEWSACEDVLRRPMSEDQTEAVLAFLQTRLHRFGGTREGSRDLLLFLLVGGLSRQVGSQLGSQITFGSAAATGTAVANSLYLSQQSWWGLLWAKFTGVPAWVGWVGAGGGLAATLMLAPLLSPLAELAVNRLRGERYLHRMLDEIERRNFSGRGDMLDTMGTLGMLSQLAPDLIALLRQLRL